MPSAPDPSSGTPADLTEVDLLMRLARRWRRLGTEDADGQSGLSPHQERALLAVARLSRGSGHRPDAHVSAAHHGHTHGSAEHHPHTHGPAERQVHRDGSAEPSRQPEEGRPGPGPRAGVRVSHLASHLGIAPRSATEVADALESAGLLTRSPDPADRRAVLLTLTERGLHTVAEVRERRRAAADAAVATLSPGDRAELRRLLEALLEA